MLSVDDAHATILDNAQPLPSEQVALGDLTSRVASADVLARLTQPPFRASAMDGYAIAFDDIAKGTTFKVVGKASAGVPFQGRIGPHQAVRIFTGSIVPIGADHVVIQEDVQINGKYLKINTPQAHPRNIRNEGIDFEKGDVLARAGDVFHALHGSLFAAANLSNIGCVRRPRVAIFTNGDELREPGSDLAPGEIVNSNYYAIVAMLHAWGAVPVYLGCADDNVASIATLFQRGKEADIIVPIGGASVGDYDFVKSAFSASGGKICFEKIAVKPGKPTWFGTLNQSTCLGLPGNPSSAIISAVLFLRPLIKRLSGHVCDDGYLSAPTLLPLRENGSWEYHLRGVMIQNSDHRFAIRVYENQDSSLLSPFLECNVLVRRLPNAPSCDAGDNIEYLPIHGCITPVKAQGSYA